MTTTHTDQVIQTDSIITDDEGLLAQAVEATVAETGCSNADAEHLATFLDNMAQSAIADLRSCGQPGVYHLTTGDMLRHEYRLMHATMPHGSTAEPGSAHAALQAYVLRGRGDVCAITHNNPTGRQEDCVVTVSVIQV